MKLADRIDSIVTAVSLILIASGAILYFSQTGSAILAVVLVLIGFGLLFLTAQGGSQGRGRSARVAAPEFHHLMKRVRSINRLKENGSTIE